MQSYRVFSVLPKLFSSVLVPLNLEPIQCPLLGYAANLFLRIVSIQQLVLVMEMCIEVRSSVRPCFLWFACAWRFSTIRLSMRFWTLVGFAWLLMLRLRRIPFRTSSSIFFVIVSHISFADAERYRGVYSTFSQLLLTWRALSLDFLLFMTGFWFAFLFMVILLLFVVCFIVCRFCCTPPTICSVNSEVVSKFDAAKVIRFSIIKSSSPEYNGSSYFGTIPLFFFGVQIG